MAIFVGEVVDLPSPLGRLSLGIVDPAQPGIAEGISKLLVRSIADARASAGGHLPDWLVADIERNYISPEKVRTLWAPVGHRFCVERDGEIVATVHVAQRHDLIFTIDRRRINVNVADHPGFKPDGHHHVVNLSVKHELRRARIATAMIDAIATSFRGLFDGEGLWVRADPPWHAGLVGLGFVHDTAFDVFLPADVERTRDLPHAEHNALFACTCGSPSVARELAMGTQKLQYVSFTRPFARVATTRRPTAPPVSVAAADASFARDLGISHRMPASVARPANAAEVAAVLTGATSRVTVRGAGQSAGGQSLSDGGIVLSTERLDRIVTIANDRVVVEGGTTWSRLLTALAPRERTPPVTPGLRAATVGGTLSSGGIGLGSVDHGWLIDHVRSLVVVTGDGRVVECSRKQAGWLFDAVLGGLGQFGVIVEATLALGTSLPVVDRVAAPPRPGPSLWLHGFLPVREAPSFLSHCRAVAKVDAGDSLDLVSVRKVRERTGSLLRLPAVAKGELCAAVFFNRELRGRPAEAIEAENRALLVVLERAGGKNALGGTLPRDAGEWRRHLGDEFDEVLRIKKLADPRNLLGADIGLYS